MGVWRRMAIYFLPWAGGQDEGGAAVVDAAGAGDAGADHLEVSCRVRERGREETCWFITFFKKKRRILGRDGTTTRGSSMMGLIDEMLGRLLSGIGMV